MSNHHINSNSISKCCPAAVEYSISLYKQLIWVQKVTILLENNWLLYSKTSLQLLEKMDRMVSPKKSVGGLKLILQSQYKTQAALQSWFIHSQILKTRCNGKLRGEKGIGENCFLVVLQGFSYSQWRRESYCRQTK